MTDPTTGTDPGSIVFGAVVALASGVITGLVVGIIVARYSARHTAELTERLRRMERRDQREEEALVELFPLLPSPGQIDHLRSALDGDGTAMARAWSEVSAALRAVEEAWRSGLSAKMSTPEILAMVNSLLGVRTWYDRQVAWESDGAGGRVLGPQGVADVERFRRAGAQDVARLDELHRMINKRLRFH